jgi:hypothetical protein
MPAAPADARLEVHRPTRRTTRDRAGGVGDTGTEEQA